MSSFLIQMNKVHPGGSCFEFSVSPWKTGKVVQLMRMVGRYTKKHYKYIIKKYIYIDIINNRTLAADKKINL
jgi:hypothetical protein